MISRRRYMGGKKGYDENSYIQNGLVFQLDGINKGNTEGSWTDLKGNLVLAPTGTPVATDKGWTFDGSSRFTNSTQITASTDMTLEVCGKFQSGGSSSGALMINGWSEGALCIHAGLFMQKKAGNPFNLFTNTAFSASFNLDKCIMNSQEAVPTTTTYLQTGFSRINIGGAANNSYLTGTIYAVRVYSRRLTVAEQKHNIKVDNKRFGLGL